MKYLAGLLLAVAVGLPVDAGVIQLQWELQSSVSTYTVYWQSGLSQQWQAIAVTSGNSLNTGFTDGYMNLFCVSRTSVSENGAESCKYGVFVDGR